MKKMRFKKRRFFALLLAFVLCVGSVDVSAFAGGLDENVEVVADPGGEISPADENAQTAGDTESTEAIQTEGAETTPGGTEEPEVNEEPEVTEETKASEEPEVTEEPEVNEEPEVTEEPKVSEEPEVPEEPKANEEPKATEESKVSEEPKATEESKASEELKVTEAPTSEEVPAEVQAFLDAVAKLPAPEDVTKENAEAIGEQVNAVINMAEALDDDLYLSDEVQDALENTVYVLMEAVLAVEEIPESETFDAGTVTKSSIAHDFQQFEWSNDFSYDGYNYYCMTTKGSFTLNDADGVYDIGTPNINPRGGWVTPNPGTYYNFKVEEGSSYVDVTWSQNGSQLRFDIKPKANAPTGDFTLKLSISFKYTTIGAYGGTTSNGNLYFWYSGKNNVGGSTQTQARTSDFYLAPGVKDAWGDLLITGKDINPSTVKMSGQNESIATVTAGATPINDKYYNQLQIDVNAADDATVGSSNTVHVTYKTTDGVSYAEDIVVHIVASDTKELKVGETLPITYQKEQNMDVAGWLFDEATNGGSVEYKSITDTKPNYMPMEGDDGSEFVSGNQMGYKVEAKKVGSAVGEFHYGGYRNDGSIIYYGKKTNFTVKADTSTDTTYTIVHEYYTNGVRDGRTTETISGVKVGQTINADNITKVLSYQGKDYDYKSATPDSLTLTTTAEDNVITLRYEREIAPNAPTKEEAENVLKGKYTIKVKCTNDKRQHTLVEKAYSITAADITSISAPYKNNFNKWEVEVCSTNQKFVEKFEKETNVACDHDDKSNGFSVKLVWNGSEWTYADSYTREVKTECHPAKTIPYTVVYMAYDDEKAEVDDLPKPETKQGTAPGSVDFIVSSQIPTRDGYEFAGWAVQGTTKKGGDNLTVTGSASATSVTETLYATWTKKPDAPKPDNGEGGNDKLLRVKVVCDSSDTNHGKSERLRIRPEKDGIIEYSVGEVVKSAVAGYEWQCPVTVHTSDFKDRFEQGSGKNGKPHEYKAGTADVTVMFYYKNNVWSCGDSEAELKTLNKDIEIVREWNGSDNYYCNYVVYHVTPQTTAKTPEIEVKKSNAGFELDPESGNAKVDYTVKITNKSGFDIYGLRLTDTLTPTLTKTGTGEGEAGAAYIFSNWKVDGKAIAPKSGSAADMTHVLQLIDRNTEFAKDQTVTLTYTVEIENTGNVEADVHLENEAEGASWSKAPSGQNPVVKTFATLFRASIMSSSDDDDDPPDVTGSGSSSATTETDPPDVTDKDTSEAGGSTGGSSTEGTLPAKYTLTYEWNLPEGANPAKTLPGDTRESRPAGSHFTVDTVNKAGDEVTANGKTYVFSGWKVPDDVTTETKEGEYKGQYVMPAHAVVITGEWKEVISAPEFDESALNNVNVKVECYTENNKVGGGTSHDTDDTWKSLGSMADGYTIGEVAKVDDNYQCVVTLNPETWANLRITELREANRDELGHTYDAVNTQKSGVTQVTFTYNAYADTWTANKDTAVVYIAETFIIKNVEIVKAFYGPTRAQVEAIRNDFSISYSYDLNGTTVIGTLNGANATIGKDTMNLFENEAVVMAWNVPLKVNKDSTEGNKDSQITFTESGYEIAGWIWTGNNEGSEFNKPQSLHAATNSIGLSNVYTEDKAPDLPTPEEVHDLLTVLITCTTNDESKVYAINNRANNNNMWYVLGECTGDAATGYTCALTLNSTNQNNWAAQLNTNGSRHTVNEVRTLDDGVLTTTLSWSATESKWVVADDAPKQLKVFAEEMFSVNVNHLGDDDYNFWTPYIPSYWLKEGENYDHSIDATMTNLVYPSRSDVKSPMAFNIGEYHYVLDPMANNTPEDQLTGTMGKENVVINLYYSLDVKGGDDPTKPDGGPDGIPDKYQTKVTFKVVNGDWNDDTDADVVKYVVKYKEVDGEMVMATDGTAVLGDIIPGVGGKPDAGFKAGAWDTEPTTTTEVKNDTIYTYTYVNDDSVTIIIKYVDEEGNEVGSETKTVTRDEEYDVTEEVNQIPDGYETNGEPTGDPVQGTADSDKLITVPVKKIVRYTVTYTDGVDDEEIFADQVTTDLREGSATPAFVGTPVREGYTFAGWNPEVADTVTGDVVYTAQWTLVDPTPVDPIPEEPTPEDPTPEDPTPVDPTPEDPTPDDPTPEAPTPTEPTTPTEPATPATPTTPVTPVPVAAQPATPAVTPVVVPVEPTAPVEQPEAQQPEVELEENETPLAQPQQPEEEAIPVNMEIEDEPVPLAAGNGRAWALVNFALMNLAVFEALMLLIGYFVNTRKEEDERESQEKKLKKKGLMRVISLPVAIISIIAFCLTEDISLPTGFVDRWTILMAIIAIAQTVVVALSRKKEEKEDEEMA